MAARDQWGYLIDAVGNCAWPQDGVPRTFQPVQRYQECAARHHGPVQLSITAGQSTLQVRGATPSDALTKLAAGPPAFRTLAEKILANQDRELFPGALLLAGLVTSLGLPGAGIPASVVNTVTAVASTVQQLQETPKMALNIGGILGAAGGIIGGINTSGLGNISQILGAGLNIASAALTPASAAPTYGPAPQPVAYRPTSQLPVVQTMASSQALTTIGSMAMQAVRPILGKMMMTLGRRTLTLSGAVDMVRKLGKFFVSPEAIAVYLGITVAEMAQLITAQASRKRRRMNPANGKALHRAARRIKSFHRMCSTVDLLKTRRRSSGFSRCGTCRKSPCRC